jgi:protein SERAC1
VAAIKAATMGIVFLGTPHRGSNKAKWASIATNFAAAVLKDHNDKVVEALSRGAETLERVQTGFSRILITLPVYSFFEDRQYEKIGKVRSETRNMRVFINWSFTIDRR